MSGEAPTPENTKSDDEGYSDDGFDDDVDPASPAASPEPTLLSIAAFIKGSQECAPTSPRTLEACFTQGIDPEDLVKVGYEMITGKSDQERKLRFKTRERRRKGYAKEVLTKYRELMAAKRPKSLPELDTVRSMMKTERENRVGSVLQREQRDLARKKKMVEMKLEQSIGQLKQADQVEKQWNEKLQKIEGQTKHTSDDRETEAICRAVWRRNKKEKASQQAIAQLERRANKVMTKEHGRVQALQKKEMKTQQMTDRLRAKSEQKLTMAAQAAEEYSTNVRNAEAERQFREAERKKAYEDSVKRHKIESELRGKQRDIVTDVKRTKVQMMEHAMVESTRQTLIEKKISYDKRKDLADEKHQQVMEKKKQWEETCQRRQQEVLQRAEDRQEELHRQLAEVEQSSTRALAKRDEQQALKQLKQDLRNEEVEQAQAKLSRMEHHKMEQMLRKVELENEKDKIHQTEKRREAELLKQLKRQSTLMQKQIKDTAIRKYQKLRFCNNSQDPQPKLAKPVSAGSPSSPSPASRTTSNIGSNVQVSGSADVQHFDF